MIGIVPIVADIIAIPDMDIMTGGDRPKYTLWPKNAYVITWEFYGNDGLGHRQNIPKGGVT
jgi:hypothetical protein